MDVKDFRAGNYKQQYQYKSFLPNRINIDWQLSESSLVNLLSDADITGQITFDDKGCAVSDSISE